MYRTGPESASRANLSSAFSAESGLWSRPERTPTRGRGTKEHSLRAGWCSDIDFNTVDLYFYIPKLIPIKELNRIKSHLLLFIPSIEQWLSIRRFQKRPSRWTARSHLATWKVHDIHSRTLTIIGCPWKANSSQGLSWTRTWWESRLVSYYG